MYVLFNYKREPPFGKFRYCIVFVLVRQQATYSLSWGPVLLTKDTVSNRTSDISKNSKKIFSKLLVVPSRDNQWVWTATRPRLAQAVLKYLDIELRGDKEEEGESLIDRISLIYSHLNIRHVQIPQSRIPILPPNTPQMRSRFVWRTSTWYPVHTICRSGMLCLGSFL